MKNRIYITTQDKQRLEDLLAEAAIFDARHRGDLKSLGEELQRAVIVDPKEIPDDVITMNSRAAMILFAVTGPMPGRASSSASGTSRRARTCS